MLGVWFSCAWWRLRWLGLGLTVAGGGGGFSVGGKANLVAYNIDFQMLVIANEKL